jgi:hypothetical protein
VSYGLFVTQFGCTSKASETDFFSFFKEKWRKRVLRNKFFCAEGKFQAPEWPNFLPSRLACYGAREGFFFAKSCSSISFILFSRAL